MESPSSDPFRHPRRIVVRATNWVGDAILTTPVYRALRRNFPAAHIAVVARPWVAGLLEGNPNIDEVIVEAASGMAAAWRTGRTLRQRGPFDLGIVLPNSFRTALSFNLGKVKEIVGYTVQWRGDLLTRPIPLPPELLAQHQVEYYLYLLKDLCADFSDVRRIEIFLREADHAEADGLLREVLPEVLRGFPLVGIAPGAAFGTAKRWPWQRYAELIARLVEEHEVVVALFGSANEQPAAAKIMAWLAEHAPSAAPSVADTCGRVSLRGSAALLSRCRGFVTNDSGAMHVAAALDVPQVAIFGPTDWVTTPPYSTRARIVRDPTECAPCLLRHCPIDHRCMTKIGVDRVAAEVAGILAQAAAA